MDCARVLLTPIARGAGSGDQKQSGRAVEAALVLSVPGQEGQVKQVQKLGLRPVEFRGRRRREPCKKTPTVIPVVRLPRLLEPRDRNERNCLVIRSTQF